MNPNLLCKNQKNNSCEVYFKNGNNSIEELRNTINNQIVEIYFEKLIENFSKKLASTKISKAYKDKLSLAQVNKLIGDQLCSIAGGQEKYRINIKKLCFVCLFNKIIILHFFKL